MATDYIPREAAISAAIDGADKWDGGYSSDREVYIRSSIDRVPAADVVERKRGHWIVPVPGDGEPYCSECKKEAPTVGAFSMYFKLTDFCPHCGADMR